jgi:hypothetical protein
MIVSLRMNVAPSTTQRWVQQGRRKPHLVVPMNLERVNALWVMLAAAARFEACRSTSVWSTVPQAGCVTDLPF